MMWWTLCIVSGTAGLEADSGELRLHLPSIFARLSRKCLSHRCQSIPEQSLPHHQLYILQLSLSRLDARRAIPEEPFQKNLNNSTKAAIVKDGDRQP